MNEPQMGRIKIFNELKALAEVEFDQFTNIFKAFHVPKNLHTQANFLRVANWEARLCKP